MAQASIACASCPTLLVSGRTPLAAIDPEARRQIRKNGTLKPEQGNHGPVRVRNTTHFAYEDGAPYIPIGTTAYAWTIRATRWKNRRCTLRAAPFNKMRMYVFPKSYAYNAKRAGLLSVREQRRRAIQPPSSRISKNECTIYKPSALPQGDLILFHPTRPLGLHENGRRGRRPLSSLRRRAALHYRSVWWSVANEWDLVATKPSQTGIVISTSLNNATPISTSARFTTPKSCTIIRSLGSRT